MINMPRQQHLGNVAYKSWTTWSIFHCWEFSGECLKLCSTNLKDVSQFPLQLIFILGICLMYSPADSCCFIDCFSLFCSLIGSSWAVLCPVMKIIVYNHQKLIFQKLIDPFPDIVHCLYNYLLFDWRLSMESKDDRKASVHSCKNWMQQRSGLWQSFCFLSPF